MFEIPIPFCPWVGVDISHECLFIKFIFPFPSLAWDTLSWFSSSLVLCKLSLDYTLALYWIQSINSRSNMGNSSLPQKLFENGSREEGSPLRVTIKIPASSIIYQIALSWYLK